MNRINPCNLPEELAQTRFVKTFDAVGTPEMLKTGICRAEYDMGPNLSNFLAFMDSPLHDPLHLSIRNRKLTQLIYIAENGQIPQSLNRLDWIGTTLVRMADPLIEQQYSPDQLKDIGRKLTQTLYPETRIVQESVKHDNLPQKQDHVGYLRNAGTAIPRQIPSLAPKQTKGQTL